MDALLRADVIPGIEEVWWDTRSLSVMGRLGR